MKITRDVVTDLLPLYFDGEASVDTRALVEAYFAEDPEFARQSRANPEAGLPHTEPATPLKESEMQTLQRTRKLLNVRAALQGLVAFFSLLPFAFMVDDKTGFTWLFLDNPVAVAVILSLAAAAWVAYFAIRRRLWAAGI